MKDFDAKLLVYTLFIILFYGFLDFPQFLTPSMETINLHNKELAIK